MDFIVLRISEHYGLNIIERLKLKFLLTLFLQESSKLLILLVLFGAMNRIPYFFAITLSIMLIRPATGGLHLKNYWQCLLMTTGIHLGLLFICITFALTPAMAVVITFASALIFMHHSERALARAYEKSRQFGSRLKVYFYGVLVSALVGYLLIWSHLGSDISPLWSIPLWVCGLQCLQLAVTCRR